MKNPILYKLKQFEGKFFTNTQSEAGKWLNYKLLKVEEGEIEASFLVRPEMCNPSGMLHGGMIGMIMDEMCGLAFFTLGNLYFYTTVNLSIDYLYSAPKNSTVIAKSKVIRSGKKIANTQCTIFDEQNNIIAIATSNLVNTGKEIFPLITS